VAYSYDGAGNLQTATEPDTGVWTFTYDATHRMLTVREPRHQALGGSAPVVENHYDANGRVDWQEDRLDRRTTFGWATEGQTTVTDPKSNITVYEHVGGICTGLIRDPGINQSRWAYEIDYATLGRTKTTDPTGVTTTATFNPGGLPATVTTPKGTTAYTYTPELVPLTIQDASGVTTTYTYDPGTDRLRTVSRPIPTFGGTWTSSLAYTDPANPGLPTSITDERGKVVTLAYAANGDVSSVTQPAPGLEKTTVAYNSLGWPLSTVSPEGNKPGGTPANFTTSYRYDRLGAVAALTDPLGAVTEFDHDLSGNLTATRDAVATGTEETTYTWDATQQLTVITRPGGSTLKTSYWPDGTVKTQTDASNVDTSYAYDTQGRLTSITDPKARVTTLGYYADGLLAWKQQPNGNCTATTKVKCVSYEYFESGEPKKVDYTDPATSDTTFTYDALGHRASMVDGGGTSTWTWDSIGRLRTVTDPVSGTIGYGYLDNGRSATSITYATGKVVNRTFDASGRLATQTGWTGGTTSFGYDANSDATTTNTSATTGVEDTYGYDRADRVTAFTLRKAAATTGSLAYTRDPEGMVSATSGSALPGVPDSASYNGLDYLTSDAAGSYTYDTADNLTGFPNGRLQKFNTAGELCYQAATNTAACGAAPTDAGNNATTYTYDERGNRATEVDHAGFGKQLTYDQADRLTSVEAGTVSIAPLDQMDGQAVPEDYDADGKTDVLWYKPGATTSDYVSWGAPRSTFGKQATALQVSGTYVPASGDFDGDGNGDILWYAPGAGADTLWFWFGRTDGRYDSVSTNISGTYVPVVGDFDADGRDDIFWYLAGTGTDSIWWGSSTVDEGASFAITNPVVNGSGYKPFAGDFNGNGTDDIFWYGPNTISDSIWYFSSTRGSYSIAAKTVGSDYDPFAGDFDGDGKDDAMWYAQSSADYIWWGQATDSSFGGANQKAVSLDGYRAPFSGDFDGDGKDDLFPYRPASAQTMWWGASRTNFGTDAADIGLPAAGATSTYTYSGDGLRRKKTTADGTVTTFAWDRSTALPLLLAETIDAPGTTNDRTVRYIYGPDGQVTADITTPTSGGETLRWYHHDQLGSTRALTNSTGDTIATYAYTSYGQLSASTGTSTTPIGWTGEYKDSETGYVYLRARYYDPATAQFLTRDPLSAVTREPYGYTGNNPINRTDPTGLCSLNPFAKDNCIGEVVVGAGGVIAGIVEDGPVNSGGVCIGGTVGFVWGASANACIVITSNGIGSTQTLGVADFATPALGGGIQPFVSNAEHVSQFGGPFSYAGGSAGPFSADSSWGEDDCGNFIWESGAGVGIGLPIPEGHFGTSETWTQTWWEW